MGFIRIQPKKRQAIFVHKAAGWKVAHIARAVGLARKAVLKEGQSRT